jgi:hypothetical protein
MQAIASSNANEEVGKFQEDGSVMMTYGEIIQ